MISNETRNELEESLGQVPSFIEVLADPAVDHSWGIMRDLEMGETELSSREKALIGLGAASSIQCPYCVHFHTEEAKLSGLTEDELKEATNVAATVRYFSTALHGSAVDMDEFKDETSAVMDYVEKQQAAAADDD